MLHDNSPDGRADGGTAGLTPMAPDDSGPGWLRSAGPFLTLGMQLALAVVVFFFIGRWLDNTLQTTPWLTVAMVLAGAAGGFISFFRSVSAIEKREKREMEERKSKGMHREN